MIVIYWFDDDYMFRPCLAIFSSFTIYNNKEKTHTLDR